MSIKKVFVVGFKIVAVCIAFSLSLIIDGALSGRLFGDFECNGDVSRDEHISSGKIVAWSFQK